jgi:outer membrane protein assembly factor BamD
MRTLWTLLLITAFTLGCSSNGKREKREDSESELYQQAQSSMDSENYMRAIETLKKLESRYPYGAFAEQAQVELIYAYFKLDRTDESLSTAERFIRLNPGHDKLDYAYYMKGVNIYYMGLSLVERYLDDEAFLRDPEPIRKAFAAFSDLLLRFPDSQYVPDARQRMLYLRNYLAEYENTVARYYLKRHAFVAASNRALMVIQEYPNTPASRDAMVIAAEAYEAMGLEENKNRMLAALRLNAPNHPSLNKDGTYKPSGLIKKDHGNFWDVITFGLID